MADPDFLKDSQKSLWNHKIPHLPDSFYYIPNFLGDVECSALLQKIPPNRWTQLSHRRLQAWPSTLTSKNTLISAPLPYWLTNSPPILNRFKEYGVFEGSRGGSPNHVLINEYHPGEGIMPHEDGAAYEPIVATISLGGNIVLDIFDKANSDVDTQVTMESTNTSREDDEQQDSSNTKAPKWRIFQEPGSLLVTRDDAYKDLLHGISPITSDEDLGPDTVANWYMLGNQAPFANGVNVRETRISLTYREVIKTARFVFGRSGVASTAMPPT